MVNKKQNNFAILMLSLIQVKCFIEVFLKQTVARFVYSSGQILSNNVNKCCPHVLRREQHLTLKSPRKTDMSFFVAAGYKSRSDSHMPLH